MRGTLAVTMAAAASGSCDQKSQKHIEFRMGLSGPETHRSPKIAQISEDLRQMETLHGSLSCLLALIVERQYSKARTEDEKGVLFPFSWLQVVTVFPFRDLVRMRLMQIDRRAETIVAWKFLCRYEWF